MIVIVPSHNQGEHIENIIRSYEKQTIRPSLLVFVFDRCTDNSIELSEAIVTDLDVRYVTKTIGENFSAGLTRDFGLSYIETEVPDYEYILFTDGDCVAGPTLIESHIDNLNRVKDTHSISCGRRLLQNKDGTYADDERDDWANGFCFTERNGRLIVSSHMAIHSILTFSCNLAFNRKAIEKCKEINLKLSNSDRLFNPEFDGKWGGEDNFISHCIFKTYGNIMITNKDAIVYHQYHEVSDRSWIEHQRNIVDNLSRRLTNVILSLDDKTKFTEVILNRPIAYPDMCSKIANIRTIRNELSEQLEILIGNKIESKVFRFMTARNIKNSLTSDPPILQINTNPNNIAYLLHQVAHLKFYIENGQIEFYDDLDSMVMQDNSINPHDYGMRSINT